MKTKPEANSGNATRALLITVALAALSGLLAFGTLYYGQKSASSEPAIPSGVNLTSWFDNGAGGQHLLRIFQGSAPAVGVQLVGTVMTDTNCDPDAQGLSHCHNIINLSNGRRIEVVNTHIMSRHPCLQPGQRLSIARLNADWIIAYEGRSPRS